MSTTANRRRKNDEKESRWAQYAIPAPLSHRGVTITTALEKAVLIAGAVSTTTASMITMGGFCTNTPIEAHQYYEPEMVRRLLRLELEEPAKIFDNEVELMAWLDAP
jgi:hypothetical protein